MNHFSKFCVITGTLLAINFVQTAVTAVPSVETVGLEFGEYVEAAYNTQASSFIPGTKWLTSTLPFGTNVGYYYYFTGLANTESESAYEDGEALAAYYKFLGAYYAQQNKDLPVYAANLITLYTAFGVSKKADQDAIGDYITDYYKTRADFYFNKIVP